MSIQEPAMDYEPDETEQKVLDVVRREKRVNPMRVREATGVRKQYVNDALRQLQKAGVVRKVNRGLYEHVPENDDEGDQNGALDVDELEQHVLAAGEAIENNDVEALRRHVRAACEVIEDAEV
ncbi:hypothetical protein [Halobellus sp. H-GB7]|uniref:hypothetical protein n=1 Tax=Halobellus sp. H-GB7 TaxID=3069756 RepID=UPI0027AE9F67|nr:hypothetical protein [Halobellus sp. H-GB7]MDQ2053217.1 hypothetical protein [Halobellus sp. H-GB7]